MPRKCRKCQETTVENEIYCNNCLEQTIAQIKDLTLWSRYKHKTYLNIFIFSLISLAFTYQALPIIDTISLSLFIGFLCGGLSFYASTFSIIDKDIKTPTKIINDLSNFDEYGLPRDHLTTSVYSRYPEMTILHIFAIILIFIPWLLSNRSPLQIASDLLRFWGFKN